MSFCWPLGSECPLSPGANIIFSFSPHHPSPVPKLTSTHSFVRFWYNTKTHNQPKSLIRHRQNKHFPQKKTFENISHLDCLPLFQTIIQTKHFFRIQWINMSMRMWCQDNSSMQLKSLLLESDLFWKTNIPPGKSFVSREIKQQQQFAMFLAAPYETRFFGHVFLCFLV